MFNETMTPVPQPNATEMTRRKFLHLGIIGLSTLSAAGCVSGIIARNDIEIVEQTITLPNLPDVFRGTTITLASDIHSGPYMTTADLRGVVRAINSLKSDLIVLPGDFVTNHRNEIPPIVETLHELQAPLGVFATTGNHEYYVDVDLVCRSLDECGIHILRNENVALNRGGEKLHLIGVDDIDADQVVQYTRGSSANHIEAAFRGITDKSATVLLNHKPYRFDEYAETGVGLMLSGHTHGGQMVFGRIGGTNFSLSRIASKYVEGHFEKEINGKKSQMYITRGIGTVALPMRLNCPPEITRITLA